MKQLTKWIHTDAYSDDDIRATEALIANYPCFPAVRILYLKMIRTTRGEDYTEALKQHTVYIPDHKQFYRYLNGWLKLPAVTVVSEEDLPEIVFRKENETEQYAPDDTSPAFEFIEEQQNKEVAVLSEPSFPVYRLEDHFPEEEFLPLDQVAEVLKLHKKHTKSHRGELIDRFIESQPTLSRNEKEGGKHPFPEQEESLSEEEFFSETLANIYIKQKLYHKALTTYLKLSLKYPEKSIYFAHLIKKTKDLINNNTD